MPDYKKKGLAALELDFFNQQMAMLLDTGLPLPAGIRRFSCEVRNPKFRETLGRMAQGLEEGEQLSEAIEKEKRFFPPVYAALIRVGEEGGNLLEALNLALEQERFQRDFRSRVKSSLFHPLLVLILACATFCFTLWQSYPVFLSFFESVGAPLPGWSMIVHSVFSWAGEHALVLAALGLALVLFLRLTKVQLVIHSLWLKIPLLGRVIKERFVASFSAGLAILLKAGVPLSDSLAFLARVTVNRNLGSLLEKASLAVREGADLGTVVSSADVFPDLYRAAALTGEKSGALPDTLSELAHMYRLETEYHAKLFLQALDGALILFTGLCVAMLLIAMYKMYWHVLNHLDSMPLW